MTNVYIGGPVDGREVAAGVTASTAFVPVMNPEFSELHQRWFAVYGVAHAAAMAWGVPWEGPEEPGQFGRARYERNHHGDYEYVETVPPSVPDWARGVL